MTEANPGAPPRGTPKIPLQRSWFGELPGARCNCTLDSPAVPLPLRTGDRCSASDDYRSHWCSTLTPRRASLFTRCSRDSLQNAMQHMCRAKQLMATERACQYRQLDASNALS